MREIRDLDHARRWGVARFLNEQSVAEHSYFVVVYCSWIWKALGHQVQNICFGELLDYAAFHDVGEQFTTDIPGPVKRAVVDLVKLKAYERAGIIERYGNFVPVEAPNSLVAAIVKLADLMDECTYLIGEERLGNTTVGNLYLASKSRLDAALIALDTHFSFTAMAGVRNLVDQVLHSERHERSKQPR